MRMKHGFLLSLVVPTTIFFIIMHGSLTYAWDSESTREELRNMKEFCIGVDEGVKFSGFDARDLTQEIFKRIKTAGINVQSSGKCIEGTQPKLIYFLQVFWSNYRPYWVHAVFSQFTLLKKVKLVEDPAEEFNSTVWSHVMVNTSLSLHKNLDLDVIRKEVIYPHVDRFIELYFKMNPK